MPVFKENTQLLLSNYIYIYYWVYKKLFSQICRHLLFDCVGEEIITYALKKYKYLLNNTIKRKIIKLDRTAKLQNSVSNSLKYSGSLFYIDRKPQ